MWTSRRFHLQWQSFPSGSCRWINNTGPQSQSEWEVLECLLWQKHVQIYSLCMDRFRTCTSNGRRGWGQCHCVCVCMCACLSIYVLTPRGHLYHLLCSSMKMEELHYSKICTNMLGNPVLSVLPAEPNRNMDLLSYGPRHTDIWFILSRADTLAPIRHQCDTLTLFVTGELWQMVNMNVKMFSHCWE